MLFLAAACGDGGETIQDAACPAFVGDPAQPLEVEIVVLDESAATAPVADGAEVPLVKPPQGGKVIFAGIRARNVETCGPVQITGSVRDGTQPTDPIIGLDGRPIDLVAGDDGWARARHPTAIESYSNIPVCPNQRSSRDIYGEEYQLTLSVVDSTDRRGSASVMVRPYCAEPMYEAECLCTCMQGYVLGQTCPGG